jgi:hypothetical protein
MNLMLVYSVIDGEFKNIEIISETKLETLSKRFFTLEATENLKVFYKILHYKEYAVLIKMNKFDILKFYEIYKKLIDLWWKDSATKEYFDLNFKLILKKLGKNDDIDLELML